ncbi:SDR family NAD(P)-dependent oxidoreductase [Paenibacillus eucommiae]|uniref:NAD(P)-dependent dehydrogenase (Short-subunit alcohol dehydrogenase family) n=1 Tax=Paenibacillus eucommiae TaxID=1355755 RepID=A0ABS4IMT0_9BACL|nr:SDR family oxidoreductase [Paenibacillus eucommiae]MBP1988878.1 NAD(P)-dependent dehydrogenase (short-subunit alcohol dehydrogenase family) [Paenibacillus eucommiae]
MQDLNGKVALVTGSTTGIGRAAAVTLAQHGVRLALHGVDEARGADALNEVRLLQPDSIFISQNLLEPEAPARIIGRIREQFGKLDIIVNNAALVCSKPLENIEHTDWDRLFAVNVKAPFFIVQAALDLLKTSKGTVVNVSSINRLVNCPNNLVYDAMKAALNHMTRGLSLDLRSSDIRVNALMPGGTTTPLLNKWFEQQNYSPEETQSLIQGKKNIATPQQIADGIAFLCSEQSSWINGAEIPIDGGYFIG